MKVRKIFVLALIVIAGASLLMLSNIEYCAGRLGKFSSYWELKEFLGEKRNAYLSWHYGLGGGRLSMAESRAQSYGGSDYSQTNVQVEGVDEGDTVKTDGTYVYVVSGQKVIIVKAYPPEEASIVSTIFVNATVKQIFMNQARLAVFSENATQSGFRTTINVYDVSDRQSPMAKRDEAFDGRYSASRMIGDYVYVVIRQGVCTTSEGEVVLPKAYLKEAVVTTPANHIYYSDVASWGYVYTTIVAANMQEDTEPSSYRTVMMPQEAKLYVSCENIYLAAYTESITFIHRIHINRNEIEIAADGQVPGSVLNQFSMDEHEDHFRIATTSNSWPPNNQLYVLNMELEEVGSLTEIAPTETIHSVRFMGDIAYLVTFKKVDPFFVIDLSNPDDPKILGELKISGYSDYLHPFGESRVIGVGKETADVGSFAWHQGIKISLFDVSDPTEPNELAKYVIGDRGSDSPVLTDHKAFLFDKRRNLVVLPVLETKLNASQYPYSASLWTYGTPVWQGACVFAVSPEAEEKLILKAGITHLEDGNVSDSSNHITRALYIEDVLYTISAAEIKLNSLLDFRELCVLDLNR